MEASSTDLPPEHNLFLSRYGVRNLDGWHGYALGRFTDRVYDLRLLTMPGYRRLRRAAVAAPSRRVHIAAGEVTARSAALSDLLHRRRHRDRRAFSRYFH